MKGVFDYFDGPAQAKPLFIRKNDFVWINSIVDDPSAEVIPLLLLFFR